MTERNTYYSGELKDVKDYHYSLELKNYNSMLEYVQAFQWNLLRVNDASSMIVDYLPLSRDDKPHDDNGFKRLIDYINEHHIRIDVRGQIHSPLYKECKYINCLYDYSKVKEYAKNHTIIALDKSEYLRLNEAGIKCLTWFEKVRENGVVISQTVCGEELECDEDHTILFVDDILGGGATLKMAFEQLWFDEDQYFYYDKKPRVHVCYKEKIFKYDDLFDVTYDFIY